MNWLNLSFWNNKLLRLGFTILFTLIETWPYLDKFKFKILTLKLIIGFFRNTEYNDTVYGKFGSKISIELDSLPTEQFKRKVVRTPLELVGKYNKLFANPSWIHLLFFIIIWFWFCFLRQISGVQSINKLLFAWRSTNKYCHSYTYIIALNKM